MKKLILTLLSVIPILGTAFLISSFSEKENNQTRENTPGTVTFSVTTQSQGGSYAPKHVLAIWVEHNGAFVKTRKAMANQRKQYLYTWKAASNYNVTDAITGPTLNSHTSHTIEWDCTDLDGNVVEDGEYVMWIEFTEKHAQGPLFNIAFEKGPDSFDITPPDASYFKDMQLTWEPEVVLIADFSTDIQEACEGETVTFTDNSTGATTWEWDFGDGANPSTANTQGPHEVVYENQGSKTISLTINGTVTEIKDDYIGVWPNADANFGWTQQSRTISFFNLSFYADSFIWDFGDGQTSTEAEPIHTYEEDGTYEVVLTAISDMCDDSEHMEDIVINTVGLNETIESTFRVYPNPGNGIFNIVFPSNLDEASVEIFDLNGKSFYKTNIQNVQAGQSFIVGKTDLPSGVYFIEVNNANKSLYQKLLVY